MKEPIGEFPGVIPAKSKGLFLSLQGPLTAESAELLREQVTKFKNELLFHLEEARKRNETDRLTNLNVGIKLVNLSWDLLDIPGFYPDQFGEWIVAAIRYLVETRDSNHDFLDPFGLDDDLAVMNAVLEAIGRIDLLISR